MKPIKTAVDTLTTTAGMQRGCTPADGIIRTYREATQARFLHQRSRPGGGYQSLLTRSFSRKRPLPKDDSETPSLTARRRWSWYKTTYHPLNRSERFATVTGEQPEGKKR